MQELGRGSMSRDKKEVELAQSAVTKYIQEKLSCNHDRVCVAMGLAVSFMAHELFYNRDKSQGSLDDALEVISSSFRNSLREAVEQYEIVSELREIKRKEDARRA